MKILVISPNNTDSPSWWRSVGPFTELARTYDDVEVVDGANLEVSWAVLKQFDLIFISRPYRDIDFQATMLAKQNGIPVWVDYDDNVLSVNEDNPKAFFFNMPQTQELVKRITSEADIVTVSTEALEVVYNVFNDNIKVLPNALDTRAFDPKLRPQQQNDLIFYRGSNTHYVDLYEHTDALLDVMGSSHGWKWLFMGFHPWWISYHLKEQGIKMVPWPSQDEKANIYWKDYIDFMYYRAALRDMIKPKLMIVPLSNTLFNRGKSNIAWVEGTYAGAAVMAPEYLPEFDKPGVIRYKDESDFKEKLQKVVKKKINLTKNADESWAYIQENLTLDKVNEKRYEIAKSLM